MPPVIPQALPYTPFEAYDPSKVPECPTIPASAGVGKRYSIATLPAEPGAGHNSSQCCLSDRARSLVMNTRGFPTQPAQPTILAHRVEPSPFGLGMFATRNIKEGDLILSERALIISPAAIPCSVDVSGLSAEDRQRVALHSGEKVMESLFDGLSSGQKKAYKSLHNSHKLDGSGPLLGLLRTNGYIIHPLGEKDLGQAGAYTGVFDQLSRINHSCGPNTTRRFHMPSFSMRLYATRDIRQGEEITASYDSVWESTELRQARMARYGFRCTCPSCSNTVVSDQRRVFIAMGYNKDVVKKRLWDVPRKSRTPESRALLMEDVETGLRLFAQEGLEGHTFYGYFLYYVCAVLRACGADQTRFREASLSLMKVWIIGGLDLGQMFVLFQEDILAFHPMHPGAPQ